MLSTSGPCRGFMASLVKSPVASTSSSSSSSVMEDCTLTLLVRLLLEPRPTNFCLAEEEDGEFVEPLTSDESAGEDEDEDEEDKC